MGGTSSRLGLELVSARVPADVARALHADGLAWLGADAVALYRRSRDGAGLELVRPPIDVRERMPVPVWLPIASAVPACQVARTGASMQVADRAYVPLRGDDGVIGVLVIAAVPLDAVGSDAIELCQRALDRAIRSEAELAERDRALAMVVHDLRSPLSAIVTSTQILNEALEAARLPDRGRGLARIERSAARMQRMVDALLDYSTLRQGAPLAIARGPGELRAVIDDAVEETRLAFPGARVELDVARGVDTRGAWDADRIAIALGNLLGNAIEHGACGAAVRVRVRDQLDAVIVEVVNEGPTIAPSLLPSIFEPFVRGDRAGAVSKRRGLGLGLGIARALVAAHGGTLELRSAAGETRAVVTLPRGAAMRCAPPREDLARDHSAM